MLRNLNKLGSSGRILGIPFRGVRGENIPTTSLIYNDLVFPADAKKEYSLRILTRPSSGLFFLREDGTGYFNPANDGTFTATEELVENGVDVGVKTTTFQVGAVGVVTTTPGNAIASGTPATIVMTIPSVVISTRPGNAVASGVAAIVVNGSGLFIPHNQSCVFDGMKNKVVFSGGPYRVVF